MSFFLAALLLAHATVFPMPGGKDDPTTLVFPPFLHIWVQKATATHLKLYTKNSVKVDNPQGVAATRLDSWEDPKRTEDDDELTVYGVNAGYNMIIFNTSRSAIAFYGMNETGERRLRQPHGIAAHRSGEVYVADTGNHRVVHFHNPGRELRYIRALTGLRSPRDVAISPDKTVYVADTGNNRIAVYRDDQLLHSWGANGGLQAPTAVAATDASEPWSYYKDAFVIVIDQEQQRLQKFSPDGQLLASRTMAGLGITNARLAYAALDYYSNLYVTDTANHCLHKFDRHLNYLTRFGRRGSGAREFHEPRGLAIYKRFGQVIIAEREAVQYYWIGTDVRDFNARLTNQRLLEVSYFLTEPSFVTLEIRDAEGTALVQPMTNTLRFAGANRETFSGAWQPVDPALLPPKQSPLAPVAAGKFTLRLTIKPTYSSYMHFEKTVETRIHTAP
ncbi:MAG: NHL repeat-containing protein [candidate division KSB1 bacterium]|nr:NHL repeat-containing protein [candidate division KSB1 bacterium]MDZ7276199.1 NHL repeat-containing protein [candidate division KSB1 bacterium]MDZ7287021.1 NHL repeat-containing protein [candidate division KSB1 bacterium]MDZ7297054.1 NHL repeat-containing protein [candidate division KSB1 bacterium]MDZ7307185.1 NHL repeat-containing protein [candidate division KSB1 bacterium]